MSNQNKYLIKNPQSLEINQVFNKLATNSEGLSSDEAEKRLQIVGKNELTKQNNINPFLLFLKQFKSFLILVLSLATVISFVLKHPNDGYIIILVILANSLIGFLQEYRAEKSIQALKSLLQPTSRVLRDEVSVMISSKDVVPGDILELEEGDKISADGRLFHTRNFQVVESSLTGESLPVSKSDNQLSPEASLADQKNMVFTGTLVATGEAKAIVTATGKNTEFGKIAGIIKNIQPKSSYFKKQTDVLARQLAAVAFSASIVIFIVGYFFRSRDLLEMFLTTTAVLVSVIPEGLPAILVVTLSVGAKKMAKNKAIIRDLPSTETLGVVNIICTDKTGTLTQNTMTVKNIFLPGQKLISLTGEGWESKGSFKIQDKIIDIQNNQNLEQLLFVCALGHKAQVKHENKQDKQYFQVIGDPTEAGLSVLAQKAGIKVQELKKEWMIKDNLMFTSSQKFRATLVENNFNKADKLLLVTGAPEVILERSNQAYDKNQNVIKKSLELDKSALEAMQIFTEKGYRTIAFGVKKMPENSTQINVDSDVKELTFLGIVGIQDPIRPEVKSALKTAAQAGIRVLMLTGDHKQTAQAIALEIGLVSKDQDLSELILEEKEFLALNEKKRLEIMDKVVVLARLNPETKLLITEILQKKGNLVAMTGDGVNDAPALKKADIGISMGKIGTDVARESSQVVLADDNFSSIILAVREGRNIFQNVRKVSYYLLSTSLAEIAIIFTSFLLGFGAIFSATQILWLNLVTDGINGIALGVNPSDDNLMKQNPGSLEGNILNKKVFPFLVLVVGSMLPATFIAYYGFLNEGPAVATSAAFFVISMSQVFNLLNLKSISKSIFNKSSLNNPFLIFSILLSTFLIIFVPYTSMAKVLSLQPFSFTQTVYLILLSSSVLWAGEAYKLYKKLSSNGAKL